MTIARDSWVSVLMDPRVGLIREESPCAMITYMIELHATTSQPTHTQAIVGILLCGKFAPLHMHLLIQLRIHGLTNIDVCIIS